MTEERERNSVAPPQPGMTPASEPPVGLLLDAERVAEKALEDEAKRCPTYADVRHRLGLLRLASADYQAARSEFEDALGIHPGYRAAYFGLRLSALLQGVLPEAPTSPTPAGGSVRDEALWACVDQAYQALVQGRDPGDSLRAWEEREPLLIHHYTGAFAVRSGDLARARQRWETASSASETSQAFFERHEVLPWSEASPVAAERVARLLWTPLAADLYTYLGRIYARNGLPDQARICYEQAYMVLPREAAHAQHEAELAIAVGDEDLAIALLTRAIEADPTLVEARVALGFEYAAQGYAEEARVQFEVAAKLAPGYADVRYNLGLLYDSAGRSAEAMEQFRRALHFNPGYLPARQSVAAHLCRTGHPEEGLREYERILRQGFQSADMLVKMGRAALELNRTEEALQYLERASFVNPEYALSYYYLGQAYKAKGLRNKARSAWRRYLEKANGWEPRIPGEEEPSGPAV